MIQRTAYLRGDVSHDAYYDSLLDAAGLTDSAVIRDMLPRVRRALAEDDKHLNFIPLGRWDTVALLWSHDQRVIDALRAAGDFWSMAGGVCLAKALARRMSETVPA